VVLPELSPSVVKIVGVGLSFLKDDVVVGCPHEGSVGADGHVTDLQLLLDVLEVEECPFGHVACGDLLCLEGRNPANHILHDALGKQAQWKSVDLHCSIKEIGKLNVSQQRVQVES